MTGKKKPAANLPKTNTKATPPIRDAVRPEFYQSITEILQNTRRNAQASRTHLPLPHPPLPIDDCPDSSKRNMEHVNETSIYKSYLVFKERPLSPPIWVNVAHFKRSRLSAYHLSLIVPHLHNEEISGGCKTSAGLPGWAALSSLIYLNGYYGTLCCNSLPASE